MVRIASVAEASRAGQIVAAMVEKLLHSCAQEAACRWGSRVNWASGRAELEVGTTADCRDSQFAAEAASAQVSGLAGMSGPARVAHWVLSEEPRRR